MLVITTGVFGALRRFFAKVYGAIESGFGALSCGMAGKLWLFFLMRVLLFFCSVFGGFWPGAVG